MYILYECKFSCVNSCVQFYFTDNCTVNIIITMFPLILNQCFILGFVQKTDLFLYSTISHNYGYWKVWFAFSINSKENVYFNISAAKPGPKIALKSLFSQQPWQTRLMLFLCFCKGCFSGSLQMFYSWLKVCKGCRNRLFIF